MTVGDQGQKVILESDHLMVEAEDVFANEALRGRMCVNGMGRCHLLFRRLPIRDPFIEVSLTYYFQHAMHLIVTQATKLSACNFVIACLNRCEMHVYRQARNRVLFEAHGGNEEAVNHIIGSQGEVNLAIHRKVHRPGYYVILGSGIIRIQSDGGFVAR